jgi:hypothetical protein
MTRQDYTYVRTYGQEPISPLGNFIARGDNKPTSRKYVNVTHMLCSHNVGRRLLLHVTLAVLNFDYFIILLTKCITFTQCHLSE